MTIHERLLEIIARHVDIIDSFRKRGIDWNDIFHLYAVLHALQIHAQSVIDFLLHTCALLKIPVETPIRCIDELEREGLITRDESDMLRRLVRFRNIVVHGYSQIDVDRVRRVVEEQGYRKVLNIVARLVDKLRQRGILNT